MLETSAIARRAHGRQRNHEYKGIRTIGVASTAASGTRLVYLRRARRDPQGRLGKHGASGFFPGNSAGHAHPEVRTLQCEDTNYAERQRLGDDLRQRFADLLHFADGGEEEPGAAAVTER